MAKKIIVLILSVSLLSVPVKAEPMQEFLMSCAYGTLAGSLLGLATLAFTEDPSSHFNNVAKGASLGLYAGIGLGAYLAQQTPEISGRAEQGKFALSPLWKHNPNHQIQIDGLQAHLSIIHF